MQEALLPGGYGVVPDLRANVWDGWGGGTRLVVQQQRHHQHQQVLIF